MAYGDSLSAGCGTTQPCNPSEVVLNLYQERGRISQTIWEYVASANSFVSALARTKKAFPAGMGDTINKRILNVNRAKETDVLDWTRVGGASPSPDGGTTPGYNPCCVTYKEIPYGDRFVSACMYQDGWMSPQFCVVDLVFKHEWEMVLDQFQQIMSQWTLDVWSHWAIHSFQHSVVCVSLNSQYGWPEQQGEYPDRPPTSALVFQHCEEMYRRMKSAGSPLSPAIPGYELVFIGDSEFQFLKEQYLKDTNDLGNRGSIMLPELGSVERIGKYLFVQLDFPRRFRDPLPGETWDDALITSTIEVQSDHGTRTVGNPDYYSKDVAKYSETIFFNLAAVDWLTPPQPLASGLNGFLAPQDYSGEFILYNEKSECDPKAKMGRFYADFMSGMLPNFPDRARCVLSLAVHSRAKDVCVDGCGTQVDSEPEKWFVRECAEVLGQNQIQVRLKVVGSLPANCPDGNSLFLVDKQGNTFAVDQIVSQEVDYGDALNPEGGVYAILSLADADAATCRTECDGWDYMACLGTNTPVDSAGSEGCSGCSPNAISTECTANYEFDSVDGPTVLNNSSDATLVTFSDPDNAAQIKTDIETALAGTTATVSIVDYHYSIQITGMDAGQYTSLDGSYITYDGGLGTPNVTNVFTGDCTGVGGTALGAGQQSGGGAGDDANVDIDINVNIDQDDDDDGGDTNVNVSTNPTPQG